MAAQKKSVDNGAPWSTRDLRYVRHDLTLIEDEYNYLVEADLRTPELDLAMAIRSLSRTIRFYRLADVPYGSLELLLKALERLMDGGRPAAMLKPVKRRGRPFDPPGIQQIKGVVAGLAQHVRIQKKFSKHAAAKWVIERLPRDVMDGLSKNGEVGVPQVIEWMDRYGGKHPPQDSGGAAFRTWSQPEPAIDERSFARVMRVLSRMLPQLDEPSD